MVLIKAEYTGSTIGNGSAGVTGGRQTSVGCTYPITLRPQHTTICETNLVPEIGMRPLTFCCGLHKAVKIGE